MQKRDFGFWSVQIPGWLLLAYLVYAQAIPAFDYQLGVLDRPTHYCAVGTLGPVSAGVAAVIFLETTLSIGCNS